MLEEGQLLRASVREVLSEGQVRLGLLGMEILATSKLALTAGQELSLIVGKEGSTVLLRPVEPQLLLEQAAPAPGASSLSDLPRALSALQQLLPTLGKKEAPDAAQLTRALPPELRSRFGDGVPPSAVQLKAFHEWMGKGYEQALRAFAQSAEGSEARDQLRALLRSSLRSIPDLPEVDSATVKGGSSSESEAQRVLSDLARSSDAWRGEQAQRAESGAPLVFPLPVREGSFLQQGRLYLMRDSDEAERSDENGNEGTGGNGAGGGKPFTLVFLLELESLGSMRIDAQMSGRDVVLGFVCALEQAAIRIHRDLPELEGHFADKGLRLVRSRVRVQRDGQIPILDLLPPAPSGTSRLDLQL